MNHSSSAILAIVGVVCLYLFPLAACAETLPVPMIPYSPQHYICYRTNQPLAIDGRLDEPEWQQAPWTAKFVDIEGDLKPKPYLDTRAKMLWDSTYFYVATELTEPDVWATLTQRDAVIYHDNDFEVFIDPDMDTHEYYELELNALNTIWDLLLVKPYRDDGTAVNAWDIQGLKSAVVVHGTLNHPGDVDSGWTVELAFPWAVLKECAHRATPPQDGDQWKINFSRVEWRTEVEDGKYAKVLDPVTRKSLPEHNWVWSPQGLIAMHYPEMWGVVQFSTMPVGLKDVAFLSDSLEPLRWALRKLYYAERNFQMQHHRFASDLAALQLDHALASTVPWPPKLEATTSQFQAELISQDGRTLLRIDQSGRLSQVTIDPQLDAKKK